MRDQITEIFKPCELSKIARETKFIQRNTNILQEKDFLELMTTVSLDPKSISLEGLCSELRTLNPEADLTPQSLMERINRPESVEFLKTIFQEALKKSLRNIVEPISPDLLKTFNNVFLEDCSECALNEELEVHFKGSGGATQKSSVKLDLVYEIKQKNIIHIGLVDRRSPDQKLAQMHLEITQDGDLWIRDLGFFDVTVLKDIVINGAYFLSRLAACVNVYLKEEDEKPIDLAEYINHHFPNDSIIDLPVFISKEKFPVRLVAYRAPKELADKRRREALKMAGQRGKTPKRETLNRLNFTFFITNVPKTIWKAEVVGTIYMIRWQIELIFKNWKSSLQINHLKGINPSRIKCLLYAKLIVIVLTNMIYKLADWYAQQLQREISLHKVVNWLKRNNRLALIFFCRFSRELFEILEKEILQSMCKGKRKRKTSQETLENGVSYCDLYENFGNKIIENQYDRVA